MYVLINYLDIFIGFQYSDTGCRGNYFRLTAPLPRVLTTVYSKIIYPALLLYPPLVIYTVRVPTWLHMEYLHFILLPTLPTATHTVGGEGEAKQSLINSMILSA